MDMNTYQAKARSTAIYPREYAVIYPALEVCDEAGEVAGKVKKLIRDNGGQLTPEIAQAIAKEMGDVLWPLANLASDLGLQLSDIAQMNLDKLDSRIERGVLGGSGDNR